MPCGYSLLLHSLFLLNLLFFAEICTFVHIHFCKHLKRCKSSRFVQQLFIKAPPTPKWLLKTHNVKTIHEHIIKHSQPRIILLSLLTVLKPCPNWMWVSDSLLHLVASDAFCPHWICYTRAPKIRSDWIRIINRLKDE